MPRHNKWLLDYKPHPNDTTGPNLLLKHLPTCSYHCEDTDMVVSRKKVPTTLKDLAKAGASRRFVQSNSYLKHRTRFVRDLESHFRRAVFRNN